MNLFAKQKQTQTSKTNLELSKEKGGGWINQGFGNNIYILYKKDNQYGPTVQHSGLYSIFYNNLNRKRT